MEKLNIAELLKDCPKDMELYSPIFGKVYLDKIRPHLAIVVTTDKKQGDFKEEFLYDGRYGMSGECMLFPSKDKTTWEGFIPFNDGDILTYIDHNKLVIYIYRRNGTRNTSYYVGYSYATNHFYSTPTGALNGDRVDLRLATEKEKQKLFDAIKANGYKWNAETKTLEKLIEENKNSEENKFPSFEPMFKMNDELEYKIPDGYEITEVSKDKVFIKPKRVIGIKLWAARNKNGALALYSAEPILYYNEYYEGPYKSQKIDLDEDLFPEVTFENSPQEVDIKLVKEK